LRGNSVFGSVEVVRYIDLPFHFGVLTPHIALDFQSAGINKFIVGDPLPAVVEPGRVSQAAMRVGLLNNFLGRLQTRVQYTRQIAGKDYVSSSTTLADAATHIRGTQWGKDWLNAGFGGAFVSRQNLRLFADYDFDLGRRTTSHTGSVTTVFMW
jgi:hypothetical protein